MYKKIKHFLGFVLTICLVFIAAAVNLQAASELTIYEPYTGEKTVSVFVKGADSDSVSVQIGTSLAQVISDKSITEAGNYVYSLILIDNSKSIKKNDRNKTNEFVSSLVLGRLPNEKLSIATFNNNQIEYLCDYSDDGLNLQNALSSIEYGSHKSYLTDILYDFIKDNDIIKEENVFLRLIVVSDGSDHDGGKYRDEELDKLLKDKKIPIYTVYCSEKTSTENIKWFTSLSRATDAQEYNLTEATEVSTFVRLLQEDSNVRKISFSPEAAMQDGTEKMVKIQVGNLTASHLIKMPQSLSDNAPAKPSEKITPTEKQIVENKVTEAPKNLTDEASNDKNEVKDNNQKQEGEESFVVKYLPFIIGGAAVLIIGIILVIWLILRRKSSSGDFEPVHDDRSNVSASNMVTQGLASAPYESNGDGVSNIFDGSSAVRMTCLTGNWEKQFSISGSVIVGRSHEQSGCVIDFDPSISRAHCEITKKNNRYFIKNLSKNGTKINDAGIAGEVELASGTVITIGRTKVKFEIVSNGVSNGTSGTEGIFY